MKSSDSTSIAALLILSLALTAPGQFPVERRLTDASGRNLDATILAESNGIIRIRRKSDAKEFDIPLAKLSAADRMWLKELKKVPDPPPVAVVPKEMPPPSARPSDHPLPPSTTTKPVQPTKPSAPVEPLFPPVAVPLPMDEIMAEQEKSGVITPPAGWSVLNTTLRFKDGRTVPGFVYNASAEKFWYAATDMVQKSASLTDLSINSRVEIHAWRNRSAYSGSPSVDLTIDGKQVSASILHSDQTHLHLLTEKGEFMENVSISKLDEASHKFLEAWNTKTWQPAMASWVITPKFTAVRPFSDDGHAVAMQGGKWGIIDGLGNYVMQPRFDELVEIEDSHNLKVRENGKCGLLVNGSKLMVPPEWEDVGDLHHGMIPVRRNNKWGYAQADGKLAIPCIWDDAWRFSSAGLAVVTSNGKRGFIDSKGKVILKPEWDGAIVHSPEGIGAVRRGNGWALVDRSGKLLCEPIWKFYWDARRFELGVIPARLADPNKYRAHETWLGLDGKPGAIPRLQEGVCLAHNYGAGNPVQFRQRSNRAIGFRGGSNYDYAEYQRQLAKEQAYSAPPGRPFPRIEKDKKVGIVDTSGNVVLKAEWDEVEIHSKEMLLVCRNGKWGLVDSKGKIRIEPTNDVIYILNQDLVATQSGLEKPTIVNISTGESSIHDLHHWTILILPNGCFGAKSRSGYKYFWPDGSEVFKDGMNPLVYVDSYGNDLIYREGSSEAPQAWWRADHATRKLIKFDNAARIYWNKTLSDFGRIWIEDQQSSTWHFCSIDGKRLGPVMARKPEKWFMDDGLGIVWQDATCHFIDKDGMAVGNERWEDARIHRHGRAAVKRNGRWGFIDEKGNTLVDCLYEDVGDYFSATSPGDGKPPFLAAACKYGKWGYIDPSGKEIIPHVGEVRGRWESGHIHFGVRGRAWSSVSIYNANGTRVDSASLRSEVRKNPMAGKWTTIRVDDGRMGITDDSGKLVLDPSWRTIKWVGQGIAAVRGKHGGGLFSPEKGWLYQDSDTDRIIRYENGEFDGNFLQHGYVIIEKTPKWGYARWKKDGIPDLLAAYEFNGGSQDSSGEENHAVPHNVNWTNDKFGKPDSALLLNGESSFLESPVNVNVNKVPHLTITAWVRSDGGIGTQRIISHDDGGYDRTLCIFNSRGKAGWSAFSGYGRALGGHPVNPGEWMFLAAVYDQVAHAVTFRVNDKAYFTKGNCSAGFPSLLIGKNASDGEYFKGAIDNVRIFSRLLSKNEIDVMYREFLGEEAAKAAGGKVTPSASHCCKWDSIDAICDGIEPKKSSDLKTPRHSWFPNRGTKEWVQLDFETTSKVSGSEVYWFDDTNTGECRVPESARILYKSGNEWKPVTAKNELGVDKDQWNRVEFDEVETTSLRLEAQLPKGYSAGVLEWKIK